MSLPAPVSIARSPNSIICSSAVRDQVQVERGHARKAQQSGADTDAGQARQGGAVAPLRTSCTRRDGPDFRNEILRILRDQDRRRCPTCQAKKDVGPRSRANLISTFGTQSATSLTRPLNGTTNVQIETQSSRPVLSVNGLPSPSILYVRTRPIGVQLCVLAPPISQVSTRY